MWAPSLHLWCIVNRDSEFAAVRIGLKVILKFEIYESWSNRNLIRLKTPSLGASHFTSNLNHQISWASFMNQKPMYFSHSSWGTWRLSTERHILHAIHKPKAKKLWTTTLCNSTHGLNLLTNEAFLTSGTTVTVHRIKSVKEIVEDHSSTHSSNLSNKIYRAISHISQRSWRTM